LIAVHDLRGVTKLNEMESLTIIIAWVIYPPSNSTVLCRICRQSSTCLNLCNSWIYCVLGSEYLSRARIYLGVNFHPVSNSQCKVSLEAITKLISHKVAKAPPTIFLHGLISLELDMVLWYQPYPY
jgi:hypothetical protein